jgi:hypothetical protein
MRHPRLGISEFPGDCPVTWAVLGANVLTFVWAFIAETSWSGVAFFSPALLQRPWTALTYPLIGTGSILGILIGGYVFWMFGGSLERSWGWRGYVAFLMLVSASSAVALWLASVVTGRGALLAGFWLPLAAITVAWTAINPYERIALYFVLPVEARWVGILAAAAVLFSLPFPLGVFALAGCGAAWWYVREGRYVLIRPAHPRRRLERTERSLTLNPIAWYRRWRLRRQFMHLVKGSKEDDDDTLH